MAPGAVIDLRRSQVVCNVNDEEPLTWKTTSPHHPIRIRTPSLDGRRASACLAPQAPSRTHRPPDALIPELADLSDDQPGPDLVPPRGSICERAASATPCVALARALQVRLWAYAWCARIGISREELSEAVDAVVFYAGLSVVTKAWRWWSARTRTSRCASGRRSHSRMRPEIVTDATNPSTGGLT